MAKAAGKKTTKKAKGGGGAWLEKQNLMGLFSVLSKESNPTYSDFQNDPTAEKAEQVKAMLAERLDAYVAKWSGAKKSGGKAKGGADGDGQEEVTGGKAKGGAKKATKKSGGAKKPAKKAGGKAKAKAKKD